MAVGQTLSALKAALAAATTKEEKFDINQMIKELKLQLKSDRQPEIKKANKSKTSENATLAAKYAKEPSKIPKNLPVIMDGTEKERVPREFNKGGMVKKYMGGGSVHKKKNTMATTKGWGASRKT